MAENYVQVPPNSTGTRVRTETVTANAQQVDQQVVSLADPSTGALIGGDAANGLDVDVTRLPAGLAQDGTDGTSPPAVLGSGTGIRGWLRSIYEKLTGTLSVTGTFWQATQPVSGPVTDTQLRATAVPISGTVTAVLDTGRVYDGAGNALTTKRAFVNIAASQTDSSIVALVASKKLRVLSLVMVAGATATNITFQSNAVAISPLFANGVNGGAVLPFNPAGWFETVAGEALKASTGAGSATGVILSYIEV